VDLILRPGSKVLYRGQSYRILSPVNLEHVLLENLATHEQTTAKIIDLKPSSNCSKSNARKNVTDLVLISNQDWKEAKRRKVVLHQLLEKEKCTLDEVKQASKQLGLAWRQVYNLLKRYRDYDQQLLALIPKKPTGGKHKPRIPFITEKIINDIIKDKFLSRQRIQISLVAEEIMRCCNVSGVKPPSKQTIRRRIASLSNKLIDQKRSARHASKRYTAVQGYFPATAQPHDVWQIDHTPVDLIIVDEVFRKPIGRPYLTLAIDVYSRCITGFCLTLEAPSTVSVGLCLTHSVFDKIDWLSKRNIKTQWPIWGKPKCIHVDNAHEFHGEALQRGCEAHGIDIIYRPPGQPHYGGIVERVIGTFMQLVHSLPGTTFSNVSERNHYPSEKKAIFTLSELEYWLTIAITDYYHQKVHQGINQPPITKYQEAILGTNNKPGVGYPPKIYDRQAFLIDFLPIEWRSLQRHGFMIDHITYNSPALSAFIGERKKYKRFLIRRDPRNLSQVYVLEPHSHRYLSIPYRTLSRPTITLWEHKKAVKWLHEKGMYRMNETLIFQAIEKMREIIKVASHKTASARRQQTKTNHHLHKAQKKITKQNKKLLLPTKQLKKSKCMNRESVQPFEDIEVW